jgi:manganese efflux pump family protein
MDYISILLLSVGLAMDAFAVSVCKGLCMKKINYSHALVIALFFGGFQALMPLIGWFLGMRFEKYITTFDHWIAFILLAFIGGKMIYEALTNKEEQNVTCSNRLNIKELFVLSIATSIDALAVGITLAFLPNTNIWFSIATIGVVTFILSVAGVFIGNKFGSKYKSFAELLGGIILVAIGCKILIEHLFF